MNATPYKLLGEAELGRIRASLAEAVGRWRDAWLGGRDEALSAVMPACDLERKAPGFPGELSRVRSIGDEKWTAVLSGRRVTSALAAALSGPGSGAPRMGVVTPLLQGVLESCLAALCGEVLGSPAEDATESLSLAAAFKRGSGAAAALAEIEGERLALVLGRGVVEGMIAAPRPAPKGGLAARAQSIQNGQVPVRVIAGCVEIGVAALSSIAPGDVILLDTALDATFGLVNPEGQPLARGYLGALAGRKAFQLTT
jgi:flagellar motor switch/type III secretory pathway protein FliN